MALTGTHALGDSGRIADDNLRDVSINANAAAVATKTTAAAASAAAAALIAAQAVTDSFTYAPTAGSLNYTINGGERLIGQSTFNPTAASTRNVSWNAPVYINTQNATPDGQRDYSVTFTAPASGSVRFTASVYIINTAATNDYAALAVICSGTLATNSQRFVNRKGAATGQTTEARVNYEHIFTGLTPGVEYTATLMAYSGAAGTIQIVSGSTYGATILRAFESRPAPTNNSGLVATEVVAPVAVVSDGKHNASPGVVKCPNGDLVAAYRKGDSETTGGAAVALYTIRSTNNGATWGIPVALETDTTYDYGDVMLSVIDGGKIALVNWRRLNSPGSRPLLNSTRIYVSSDNGLTWNAPLPVNTGAVLDRYSCSTSALTYFNGAYYLAIWGEYAANPASTYDAAIMRSTDLVTWTLAKAFPAGNSYNEAGVAVVGSGLVALVRSEATATMSSSTSADGVTWSALRQVSKSTSGPKITGSTLLGRSYIPMRVGTTGYGYLAAVSDTGDVNRIGFLMVGYLFAYGQAIWLGGNTIGVMWSAFVSSPDARIQWATYTVA